MRKGDFSLIGSGSIVNNKWLPETTYNKILFSFDKLHILAETVSWVPAFSSNFLIISGKFQLELFVYPQEQPRGEQGWFELSQMRCFVKLSCSYVLQSDTTS